MNAMTVNTNVIEQLANLLRASSNIVAFTGAGISTESGIPDFRSPGGVWSKYQPVEFDDFLRHADARRQYWTIRRESVPQMLAANPNAGHNALVELEQRGKLKVVVTQNIDELHQRAGSTHVLELHGTAMQVHCLECDKRWTAAELQPRLEADELELICDACDGIMKSMTVSFGQALPADVLMDSMQRARECDLMIAIGSSLVVYPANEVPATAKRNGAKLVILNRDKTPLDSYADLVIRGEIGLTLSAAVSQMS